MNSSLVEKLLHWEHSGGSVRIVHLSEREAVVELRACTGELMERFSSTDRTLLEHLSTRALPARPNDSGSQGSSRAEH